MPPNSQSLAKLDFSFLDESAFRGLYLEGTRHQKMRFYVEGIRCAKCLRKIEGLVIHLPGLIEARAEMGKNLVHVEFDPDLLNPSQIATRLSGLGFKIKPLLAGTNAENEHNKETRKNLVRLAVAGTCAGNIMGFALAIYFGSDESWSKLFAWLSFAVYLPVVTYVALPFYQGAWNSLKLGRISIDLPMAVASLAGFVFSTTQLLNGQKDFYFDSMSGFLFLILLARFIQHRIQRRYLIAATPLEELNRVRRFNGKVWTWSLAEQLTSGDEILLEFSEALPVEAELLSPRAHFSLAWLTGESQPRLFLTGAVVPAGAQLLSGSTRFGFRKALAQTSFGQTMDEVQRFSLTKNRTINAADKWTQVLLVSTFTLAVGFLILYWQTSPEEAVKRALALIVLACPCAMAFGTPLALAFSLKKASAAGILIADANIFEAATKVKNIFFDKTGTLTDLDLSISSELTGLTPVYKKILLALENQSLHPIAFAFRKTFADQGKLPPVGNYTETPGVGVSGYIFGKYYSLRRDSKGSPTDLTCALYEDENFLFRFQFETNLKPGVLEVLSALRERGYRVQLLSGDQAKPTFRLANSLGFSPSDIHADLSPEQKAALVGATPFSMMIGDGVNDAHALMRADVGIAVAGAVGAALKSARVYLTSDNFTALLHLFTISHDGFRLIRQNLIISLIYNVIGAALALGGYVNPLVAAVLMPLSSGLILFNTWGWGRR